VALLADGRPRSDDRPSHHFLNYAKEGNDYARQRYIDEVNRLFGVMNARLAVRKYLAGEYSIADMACVGWVLAGMRAGQNIDQFPNLKK
jgi:GST-like protein